MIRVLVLVVLMVKGWRAGCATRSEFLRGGARVLQDVGVGGAPSGMRPQARQLAHRGWCEAL
jgi:hypothetical protein